MTHNIHKLISFIVLILSAFKFISPITKKLSSPDHRFNDSYSIIILKLSRYTHSEKVRVLVLKQEGFSLVDTELGLVFSS